MKKITFEIIQEPLFFSIKILGDFKSNGRREEGSRDVCLENDTFVARPLNGTFAEISDDLKALCAILCFYPSLPDETYLVDFGFNISVELMESLQRPYITPNARYSTKNNGYCNKQKLEKTVISYGGGIDSLAAHCLFDEFELIHQTPMAQNGKNIEDVVCKLIGSLKTEYQSIEDNMRQLYSVWGLPLWVSVFVPSILSGARNIISGSELTGTYLEGGKKYFPRYRNLWYSVFKSAGVNIYATSFLSEIGNAKVCKAAGVLDKAAYCQFIRNVDCGGCSKCLRRRLIKDAIKWDRANSLAGFSFNEDIVSFLKTKPLYYGDVFAFCLHSLKESAPSVFDEISLSTFSDVDFHDKFYSASFSHFNYPKWLEDMARKSLHKFGIEEMNETDIHKLTSYVQNY